MEPEKIYFDMDGVLVDFFRGIRELCGIEPSDQNNMSKEQDEAMFAAMRKVDHFYLQLKPMPGALELLKELCQRYGDRVEILSAIPKPERGILHAKEDKLQWVKEFIGDIKVNIVLRKEKQDYAGKGRILIDDTERNIREWEEAGGSGIVFRDVPSLRKELSRLYLL